MIINCAAYQQGQKIADLAVEAIKDYLDKPDVFVWRVFNLNSLALDDAKQGHQRPKIEEYADSLFAVLHVLEFDADETLHLGEVNLFVSLNYLISVRRRSTVGFADVRERCEREPELLKNGTVFVLYAIMDAVVDRYFPIVTQLEQKLEAIEENIFSRSASTRVSIEALYDLKKQQMIVQHAVASLLDAVSKLHGHGGRVPPLFKHMQDYFRDISDHMMRLTKSIENIREMTTTAINVNLAMISLIDAEVTKKLASYGALFALPTAIAGIYGMNFKFIPELSWTYGYPYALSLMVILDVCLWFKFRRVGWL